MKLYTISNKKGESIIAVETNGRLIDINKIHKIMTGEVIATDMLELIQQGNIAIKKAEKAVRYFLESKTNDGSYEFSEIRVMTPISRPGKIFCSGLNYKSHIKENPNAKFLHDPRFFSKAPSIVIGPGEPIKHPGEKFLVDWEVELCVVFGKTCHRANKENAMDHVFGYTILHDVSARYIQFKDNNEVMGKNFDSFCPVGPCIVTADELTAPEKEKLTTRINGEVVQDGTNEDWCFSLPHLIEWLSMAMTLEPGDLLSTGTPAGVGLFHKPPIYLKPGDTAELEIGSIGKLSNPVIADFYEGREI